MRAAVVGSNWGGVHVAALRDCGVEVVALAGRGPDTTRSAAQHLGIPRAVTELPELRGLDLDLITVATPPGTHAQVIADLPDVPVICEKPAVGNYPPAGRPPGRRAPIWVNYAFGFLPTAQAAAARIPELGTLLAASAASRFDLAGDHTRPEWFFELVTHPWSWVAASLGPARAKPAQPESAASGEPRLEFDCDEVPVSVSVTHEPGLSGIQHEVHLLGERGELAISGTYRVGGMWHFGAPELRTGQQTTPIGAAVDGPPDPWYQANVASFRAVLASLAGRGRDPLLYDWDRAVALDRAAQQALAALGT